MEEVLILARVLSDGKLWQARHINASPGWTWAYATESEGRIMGHLVLTVADETSLPRGPGSVTPAMLPGPSGEGATHP